MQKRPKRISINNVQGKKTTLNSGPDAFASLKVSGGDEHIILGLGPMLNENLHHTFPKPELANEKSKVFYLECADFATAVRHEGGQQSIPEHWQSISQEQLVPLLSGRSIWWYKQNMHFYPEFWASILGMVQAWVLRGQDKIAQKKSVFVAGSEQQLLHKEVCMAFAELGFFVHTAEDMRHILEYEQPALFFSINLRGLDREGADFALLQALGIPVAIWFVDNPWHILSSLRLPWWKDATLFVTDASFIAELKKQGAKYVHHLPLAASQHMWQAKRQTEATHLAQEAGCIFVGRAAFPDNAQFFAAAKVPEDVQAKAMDMLNAGRRPHFHWWQEHLQISPWPGHAVRCAGLGAEECACQQRVMWLKALLAVNPVIFGDSETWVQLLPQANTHIFYPYVDYYEELADVYAAARAVLNVTSLLLPAGLTQRHFDVWAAGGFLFTDITEGLDIFPKSLTDFISVEHPSNLANKIKNLGVAQRAELISAWQEIISAEHSYTKRMNFVLNVL